MGPSEIRKMMDDLAEANKDREHLKQKCHDLENRVTMIEDEKNNVVAECEMLQKMHSGSSGASAAAKDDSGIMNKELKKQMESLQDELFKSENQRDEFSVKAEMLEKQLEEAQGKEMELQVRSKIHSRAHLTFF